MQSIKKQLAKMKSDFLTYKYVDILESFHKVIELLDKEKNINTKNYRKLYVYSIVHLIYKLEEENVKAEIYLEKMRGLEINSKKLSNRMYYTYIPFTRMGIKSLFKQEYFQNNYSKKLLDEIIYDSGKLGFIEDLFIIEGSDTIEIVKKVINYLVAFSIIISIAVYFIKNSMTETAISFLVLTGISFYVYFDYRMR
jgi:hypothetical protein